MTSSSRHVLVLAPLLFGSCVQSHLAATCARGAVVRIWLDLQRKTGLTHEAVYMLSISHPLIRSSDTETSIGAISKFWSTGAAEYCISLCPKMRYAFPRSPRALISYFSVSYFKKLGVCSIPNPVLPPLKWVVRRRVSEDVVVVAGASIAPGLTLSGGGLPPMTFCYRPR